MDPNPNAWTFGDTRVYITLTSGLVEMMTPEELDAVIAHECGHILCRHVLYHSVANYILKGVDSLGILGNLTIPIQFAILYWQRKSELSCDRVGSIITSPEVLASTMARLSGGPRSITAEINMEEWAKQADEYEEIRTGGLWNKTLQMAAVMSQNHPFTAVRVKEILNWSQSIQYQNIRRYLDNPGGENVTVCPSCGSHVESDWMFCQNCGCKLK